jgi:hypothetical protein
MAGRVPGRGADTAPHPRPDPRRAIFVNGILAERPDEDAPTNSHLKILIHRQ